MSISINKLILLALSLLSISCHKNTADESTTTVNHPFPNHTQYLGTHIIPNQYSQEELDNHVKTFYETWKNQYLKNDCNQDEYYIYSGNGAISVSEAQGYGMMISCFMAGYDSNAKKYFDGLYTYYQHHSSTINPLLMDWQQLTCNDTTSNDDDSASDGDIDIAFSLLLADKQWGSEDDINYLEAAKTLIGAIMQDEINHETWTVKLGDWVTDSSNYYYGTRISDFITSHFKKFASITNDNNWNTVVTKCYSIINQVQHQQTGLVPDFVINTNTTAIPAGSNYLENANDGAYYYNACRFPWRMSVDYLLTNDNRAVTAVNKINNWLRTSNNGNVMTISNGYQLDGTALFNWNDATFIAPFTVGAMLDTSHQEWLNNLYDLLIDNNVQDGEYYANTIELLALIVISENYWD